MSDSQFRSWITSSGDSGFKAEAGRYHLYVSLACPYASRTLLMRKLKGLEDAITVDIVDYERDEKGWRFNEAHEGCTVDTVHGFKYLKEIYLKQMPNYSGRVTVPILYDKQNLTIVNNESSEIIRMFNSEFNGLCDPNAPNYYPECLQKEIDELNGWIGSDISSGVYGAGFATSQESYDKAVRIVFDALDRVEAHLSTRRYLAGPCITDADIRLFTSLVRFDLVYVGHFKCNKKRIVDYPNLWGYLRDLYTTPGFGDTTNRFHIENHYQLSHRHINPKGIVAIGPDINYNEPHNRHTIV